MARTGRPAPRYRPLFAGAPTAGRSPGTDAGTVSTGATAPAGGAAAGPDAVVAGKAAVANPAPWPPFTTLTADALAPLLAAVTAAPSDLPLLRSAVSAILACPELAVDADGAPPEVPDLDVCLPWVQSFLGVFVDEVDVVEAALRLLCAAATSRAARGLGHASHLVCFALGVHRGEPRVVAHGVALLHLLAASASTGPLLEQLPFVLPLLQRYRGLVDVVRGGVGWLGVILTDHLASLSVSTLGAVEDLVLCWLDGHREVRRWDEHEHASD